MTQVDTQGERLPTPDGRGAPNDPTNAPKTQEGKGHGTQAPGDPEQDAAPHLRPAPRGRPDDPPFKPSPILKPSDRRRLNAQAEDAAARARRRYAFWVFQSGCSEGLSLLARFEALREAINADLVVGPAPSQTAFYDLVERGRDALAAGQAVDIHAFLDRPRSGRPQRPLHPRVAEFVLQQLRLARTRSKRRLLELARAEATRRKLRRPTRYQLEAYLKRIPPVEHAAALHGTKAALLDATPHPAVPASFPHESWTLDEVGLPVWMRAFDRRGQAHAVKPWAVVVCDSATRVCIAARVVWALGTGPDHIVRKSEKAREEDVLGTLFEAAVPELAPLALRPYAGFLPQSLRMDGDGCHVPVRAKLLTRVGLDVPKLAAKHPHRRGVIERLIQTIEARMGEGPFASSRVDIAELAKELPQQVRRRATETLVRTRVKDLVAVHRLPTYEQVQAELLESVVAYNATVHQRLGCTPQEAYHRQFTVSTARRSWRDLVLALEASRGRILREGLKVGQVTYAWSDRHVELDMNDEVAYYEEPLRRAVFLRSLDGRTLDGVLVRREQWSRELGEDPDGVGAHLMRERRRARAASVEATAERREALASAAGAGVVEEGLAIHDARLQAAGTTQSVERRNRAAARGATRAKDGATRSRGTRKRVTRKATAEPSTTTTATTQPASHVEVVPSGTRSWRPAASITTADVPEDALAMPFTHRPIPRSA